jgi:hypothetical protein
MTGYLPCCGSCWRVNGFAGGPITTTHIRETCFNCGAITDEGYYVWMELRPARLSDIYPSLRGRLAHPADEPGARHDDPRRHPDARVWCPQAIPVPYPVEADMW